MIIIKQIDSKDTYPLRIEVLRNGIAKNYHFEGDNDSTTFHLGVFINNELKGIATFIKNNNINHSHGLSYQLRGMAIAKLDQNQGIGKLLVEESYRILKHRDCTILWCNARKIAVEFYKKLGFIIKGDSFYISNIGLHYTMFKTL